MANPWDCMSVTFRINDARLVATLSGGRGAIVEEGISFEFNEGRCYTYQTLASGEALSTLEYHCDYYRAEAGPPVREEHAEARVVIAGTHENGLPIELRGNGWVGYDEKGDVSGTFIEPPDMLIADLEDEEGDEESSPATLSAEEFSKSLSVKHKMPPHFEAALRRAGYHSEDEN